MPHSFVQSFCALQWRAYANACDDLVARAGFKINKTIGCSFLAETPVAIALDSEFVET